jgi:hypothetical protein
MITRNAGVPGNRPGTSRKGHNTPLTRPRSFRDDAAPLLQDDPDCGKVGAAIASLLAAGRKNDVVT